MARKIQNYVPSIGAGAGVPFVLTLSVPGTLAAPSVGADEFTFNPFLPGGPVDVFTPASDGSVVRVLGAHICLQALGTGAGGTEVKIVKNRDAANQTISNTIVTVAGATKFADVDLRGDDGDGAVFLNGETVSIDVPAVTGNADSAGLKVHLVCVAFGANG